jgi:hypothetical protein
LNPEEEIKQDADAVVVKSDLVSDLPWEKDATPTTPHFSLSTTKKDVDSKIDDLFNF